MSAPRKDESGETRPFIPLGPEDISADFVDWPETTMSFSSIFRSTNLTITKLTGNNLAKKRSKGGGNQKVLQFCLAGRYRHISEHDATWEVVNQGQHRDTFRRGRKNNWITYECVQNETVWLCVIIKGRNNFKYKVHNFASGDVVEFTGPRGLGQRHHIVLVIEGEIDWGDGDSQPALTQVRELDPRETVTGSAVGDTKIVVIE